MLWQASRMPNQVDTQPGRKQRSRKRSAAQSAGVIVRMAPAERDALNQVAAARGTTTSALMRQHVMNVISGQQ